MPDITNKVEIEHTHTLKLRRKVKSIIRSPEMNHKDMGSKNVILILGEYYNSSFSVFVMYASEFAIFYLL